MSDIKSVIIERENKNKKEIEQYDLLHTLDLYKNYNSKYNKVNKPTDEFTAKLIYENYDKLEDDEMKHIVTKVMSNSEIKFRLLRFELENYKTESKDVMTITEFTNVAIKLLRRYQHKAGGFYLEDEEWTVHASESSHYVVLEDEVIFENTIDKYDLSDNESYDYLNYLEKRLANLTSNIKVVIETTVHEEGPGLVLIKCINKKGNKKIPNISL